MQAVTITQISPSELEALIDQAVKKTLLTSFAASKETDEWFDLNELRRYLPDKPAKATLYGYVASKTIPHHKGPKKLRFLKSEIDCWLKESRKKTRSEIEDEVDTFLSKRSRSGGRRS